MSSYAENGGIILASDIVVQDNSPVTYRWLNDGEVPAYVITWGYRQSIGTVSYEVEILPGTGSPRQRAVIMFQVKTVVGGEPIIIDGRFGDSSLVRYGEEDDLIEIEAVKPEDNPNTALWTIALGKNWYTSYTTVGTVRCSVTLNIIGRVPQSVETTRNEVEAEPPRTNRTWVAYEPVQVSRGKRTQ